MERPVRRFAALVLPLVLTLGACSSSGKATGASPSAAAAAPSTASGNCGAEAGLSGRLNDHGTVTAGGSAVALVAGDFFFQATCVKAAGDGTLTVTVKNEGQALHNFSITSLGIDEDVAAGKSITVKVELPSSGALPFFCKYHVGAGMQGAFLTS